ncbi:hypothetical protein Clacol_009955 [Clathrus columnatus]|uniref:U3 small nucleolar RNA-associated protein 14 homolog A n=1 Tax=Clathrus columnatus TaxID=1419009 RepID=A0AAV5ALX5_9AGAM|nr:hypothetical protein Clacol_009955 [Clathrus columnatus]
MAPTRGKKHTKSVAEHNASGFAKRRAKPKKNSPKSLDDVYEYSATKNRRSAVKLVHDKEEFIGIERDNEDHDNSGLNIEAIRSQILDLGDTNAVINSDEDEEIDSDVAFEESDNEQYAGFSFPQKGTKNKQAKKSKKSKKAQVRFEGEIDMHEDAEEDVNGSDEDEEVGSGEEDEYLDVLDVLDGRGEPYFGDESDDEKATKTSSQPKRYDKDHTKGTRGNEEKNKEAEDEEDEESEESGDEDEDEDEAPENPFLPSDDDNEENIDHLDSFIANLDTTRKRKADEDALEQTAAEAPRKKRILKERTQAGAENEFNVRMTSAPRLELSDLITPLEATSALQSLRKSTKSLTNGQALPIPLPLRSQEKLDREAAYEQTKTEVDKWNDTMKRIKQAEHLTFPLQAPQKLSASNAGLAAKFKPTTEMENAVDKLLRAANLREDSDITKTEELKLNHLSVEEVAQRRAELRKMRDLMFRAEIKAKRIAKIKSKTYRKIHKKAREKLEHMAKEADGEVVNEEEERLRHEMERARERATLRHKNTGKWAKAMQGRAELDIDQRREIEEMLEKGERLRRKIQATGESDDDEDDGDDTSDIGVITAQAFQELQHLDQPDDNLTPRGSKGVFAMKFMQNAMARDTKQVDATVDQFREEMERLGNGVDGASDDEKDEEEKDGSLENLVQTTRSGGRMVFHPGQITVPRPPLAPSESSSTLKSSEPPILSPAVASQITLRSSPPLLNEDVLLLEPTPPSDNQPPVSEPNPWLRPPIKAVKTITKHEIVIGKHSDQERKMKHQMQKQLSKSVEGRAKAADDANVEIAPDDVLLLPTESSTIEKKTNSKGTNPRKSKIKDGTDNNATKLKSQVDAAYDDSDADSEIAFQEDHLQPNGKTNSKAFKQKDLVALAFAGDNVVENFEKLKKQEVEGDAPREEDSTIPGWGMWGGLGVKANPKAKKFIKKIPGVDPTTRADYGKPHVIISEKKDKKAAKYHVKDLPYPYTSKAQFEKVMETPVGVEWNSRDTFQKQTLPRVLKKLYVYDLSNGLARQMSRQLTGKQIDGIWHTSVVVFGMEVFYGQGISITLPGKSHHGSPLHIVDMGETGIDKETFEEYLQDIREHYTADKPYEGISLELPQEFLSTPFGAALRPTIDAMFRRPSAGAPTVLPPSSGSSLLNSVASRAAGEPQIPSVPSASTSTLSSPLQISTNPASFHAILSSHRCVSVFFTSSTCAPCNLIAPTFEDLAWKHAKSNVIAFVKVDMGVGLGNQIAQKWGIRVTPTFMFFLDGKKSSEFKGADKSELRTQVELLIFQAFPPHPHTKTKFPGIQGVSLDPILFKQPPAWDLASEKLISSIDAVPNDSSRSPALVAEAKQSLLKVVIPFLKSRFPKTAPGVTSKTITPPPTVLYQLSNLTAIFLSHLAVENIFPLIDFWRMAVLDKAFAVALVSQLTPTGEVLNGNDISLIPVTQILSKVNTDLSITTNGNSTSANNRNTLLTTLRLLSNVFSFSESTGKYIFSYTSALETSPRTQLTTTLVSALLHADPAVRTAAASLAFNVASCIQRTRRNVGDIDNRLNDIITPEEDSDWEIEIISAIVEAIKLENTNEDIVHRLTASLAFLLYLSPNWTSTVGDFVQVLDITSTLRGKIKGGIVKKPEVTKLLKAYGNPAEN